MQQYATLAQLSNHLRDGPLRRQSYDIDTRIGFISDDWRDIMGYTPDGRSWNFTQCFACIHPDDRQWVLAMSDQALASASSLNVEFRITHPIHNERWVLARIRYILPTRKAPTLLVSSIDITERERAEVEREQLLAAAEQARQEAEAAVHIRDEFISIAAHELRTPLTAFSGFATLLQQHLEDTAADARAQRMSDNVVRQAERLNKLITQLFDVKRMQHGQFDIKPQPVDLGKLVGDVVESFHMTLPKEHPTHEIRLTTTDQPLILLGDPQHLEEVSSNLLSNAVKYSPSGSTVEVRLAQHETDAVLEVIDHGIGIPAAAQAHIYAPFYRASNANRGASGLGLGLYLVSEIVKRHGGRIEISSTEDVGSTFRVSLPLIAGANESLERSVGL